MSRIGFSILALILAAAGREAAFPAFEPRAAPPIESADSPISQPAKRQARGAVVVPGVYELPASSRVQDAVQAAGGLDETVDLSTIKLARRVRDGEVIVIAALPVSGEATDVVSKSDDTGNNASNPDAKVNINAATESELEALPGIGKVIAQRIVAFREANGPFHSVDDLIQIDGISTRTVESLRDLVTTGP